LLTQQPKCLAVIRLRGCINVRREVKDTLLMLHLPRANHATLIPSTQTYRGMLQTVKDYVTWGEVSKETLVELLKKRGEVVGGKKLSDNFLKQKLKYSSIEEIAEALYSGTIKLTEIKGVKPVFRLHPPSKGFKKSLKRSAVEGGEMGYRGDKINDLIKKMI
jgi:large subunit ribosomal protein L30